MLPIVTINWKNTLRNASSLFGCHRDSRGCNFFNFFALDPGGSDRFLKNSKHVPFIRTPYPASRTRNGVVSRRFFNNLPCPEKWNMILGVRQPLEEGVRIGHR